MPIKHAALKQIRKDRKRHQRSQAVRSKLKTLTKRLDALLDGQQLDEAKALMPTVVSSYAQAASKRVIHPNTARRYTSRLMRRLNRRAPTQAGGAPTP